MNNAHDFLNTYDHFKQVDVKFCTNFIEPMINLSKDELTKAFEEYSSVFVHCQYTNGNEATFIYGGGTVLKLNRDDVHRVNETITLEEIENAFHNVCGIVPIEKYLTDWEDADLDENLTDYSTKIDRNTFNQYIDNKVPFVLIYDVYMLRNDGRLFNIDPIEEYVIIRYDNDGNRIITFSDTQSFDQDDINYFEQNQINIHKLIGAV